MKLYNVYDIDGNQIGERMTAGEVTELCGIDSNHLCSQARRGSVYKHRFRFTVAVNFASPKKKEPIPDWSKEFKQEWEAARKKILPLCRKKNSPGGGRADGRD